MVKIISWNINSLRLRIDLLKNLITKTNPDILCLQEIKVANCDFPFDEVKKLGFDFIEFDGEKSYNGVAIFSKFPLKNIVKIDVENYQQKRHIKASISMPFGEINLHNFYIPAGGDVADVNLNPKFAHKIKFLEWMMKYFSTESRENNIILGDFNIAPNPNDVWSHRQLINVVSHTEIEVMLLNKIKEAGEFIDCHRHFVNENDKIYSWWSYRALEPFKSNRGRRLDHIWISNNLIHKLQSTKIYSDFRVEKTPSDHVPIEVSLSI